MRTSIALAVIAMLLLLAALLLEKQSPRMRIRRQTLIPYVDPPLPEAFHGAISYRTGNREGPSEAVDDGPSTYIQRHANGWRGCIWSFYVDRRYGVEPIWELDRSNELFQPPEPPHLTVATNDGWFACVEQLEERLRSVSDVELRRQLDANIDQHLAADKRRFFIAAGIAGVLAIGFAVRSKRASAASEPHRS